MPECTHGMPSPASCVDCMDEGPVVQLVKPKQIADVTMVARYDSRCPECNTAIEAGDKLYGIAGLGWVGGCCGREKDQ